MNILAIETSGRYCGVSIFRANAVVKSIVDQSPLSHSTVVLEMIERVLCQSAVAWDALNAIAVTRGPGSFTGLRIGIAVAQGLAFARNLPIVPISSLAQVALAARRAQRSLSGADSGECEPLAVDRAFALIDARMGEVYAGCYDIRSASPVLCGDERVIAPQKMGAYLDLLVEKRCLFVGSGLVHHSDFPADIIACDSGEYPGISTDSQRAVLDASACEPHPELLALLAADAYTAGFYCSAGALAPTYLRNRVTHSTAR